MMRKKSLNATLAGLLRKLRDPMVPIAFGVILLLLAGLLIIRDGLGSSSSADDAAHEDGGRVLVAASDLSEGQAGADLVAGGYIEARDVADPVPPGAVHSESELLGQVIVRDLNVGATITRADLRPATARESADVVIPEGMEGVALTLPFTAAGAGYVGAGDTVNVYSVLPSAEGPRLVLVATSVQVLDVSAEVAPYVGSADGPRPGGSNLTLLLALDPEVAAAVILVGSDSSFHLSLVDEKGGSQPRSGSITLDEYLASVRGSSLDPVELVDEGAPQ